MAPRMTSGEVNNRLTAIKPTKNYHWLFRCDCGNKKEILVRSVRSGNTKSCGCLNQEAQMQPGEVHGRLTAIRQTVAATHRNPGRWLFHCTCGNDIERVVGKVRIGHTKSCGCLNREMIAARNRTHGASGTPEWYAWKEMNKRCRNPHVYAYHRYGGRGIRVCAKWKKSFSAFLKDVGLKPSVKHSLGRIDNDGNYTPSNVHWEIQRTQARNRHTNLMLFWEGKKRALAEICELTGVDYNRTYRQLRKGVSLKKIITGQPSNGTS
jgi:hypothetical protein